eukprot:gene23426-biopygen10338
MIYIWVATATTAAAAAAAAKTPPPPLPPGSGGGASAADLHNRHHNYHHHHRHDDDDDNDGTTSPTFLLYFPYIQILLRLYLRQRLPSFPPQSRPRRTVQRPFIPSAQPLPPRSAAQFPGCCCAHTRGLSMPSRRGEGREVCSAGSARARHGHGGVVAAARTHHKTETGTRVGGGWAGPGTCQPPNRSSPN